MDPGVSGLNLAVSGANTADLLSTRSDAATTAEIDSESDLVLFPRVASQIEIAEALRPEFVACWIGSNDVLGAVTTFDRLDGASNITPLWEFQANFAQIAARLAALNSKVVFGTIPDVTRIAYLIDRHDLIRLTGQDYGLPEGVSTTAVIMLGLKLGLIDANVLTEPNFVLDEFEAANISQRIAEFNDVIRTTAAAHGIGVAETGAALKVLADNEPVLFGVPLSSRFLGGLFSLDGVHPSNFGHLLTANVFVEAFNAHYGLAIPAVNVGMMVGTFFLDPFIDKDADGRVTGRPGAGLLETIAWLIQWSGDADESAQASTAGMLSTADTATAVDVLERRTGKNLRTASRHDRLAAISSLFDVKPHGKKSR